MYLMARGTPSLYDFAFLGVNPFWALRASQRDSPSRTSTGLVLSINGAILSSSSRTFSTDRDRLQRARPRQAQLGSGRRGPRASC